MWSLFFKQVYISLHFLPSFEKLIFFFLCFLCFFFFFWIKCFESKKAAIWRLEESQSYDKLFHKQWLPIMKWNKHLSKQFVSITCTLEKTIFDTRYFWRFVSRFFWDTVEKLLMYFGLYESSLHFYRSDNQTNTVCKK